MNKKMEFPDESQLYLKKRKRETEHSRECKPGDAIPYIEIPGKPGEPGKLDIRGCHSHLGCRLAKPIRNPGEKERI